MIVFFPHNGGRCEQYVIRGPTIADLQVVDANSIPPPTSTARPLNNTAQQASSHAPVPAATVPIRPASNQQQRQPSEFVDPAILSYGRSPGPTTTALKPPEPSTPIKSMLAKAAESLPTNTSPFIGGAGKSSGSHKDARSKDSTQQVRPFTAPQTQTVEADGTQEAGQVETSSKKKARRSQKKKPVQGSQDPPPVMNVEVSRNGNDMNGSVKRGKGWRQTPLLQPSPQTTSPQNQGSTKTNRRENEAQEGQQNGWATEDANDIQDMADFDFEANHKLFDKKEIFDQLRQGDTTADEDRLVGHNKVHRPGTYGGKNLHPTENVLSPKLGPKYNSNEMDSTSDADTELNFPNGRPSSRHSISRVSMKKQPSRQNSAQVEAKPHPLTASMSSARSVTSLSGKFSKNVPPIATSPLPARTRSPVSAVSTTKTQTPSVPLSHISEPHFAIRSTLTPSPVLFPTALETLELETVSRYGLTHDAITESAARSIAEMAMGMFDIGSRHGSCTNTIRGSVASSARPDQTAQPVVVVIAGNHALGARAVAAARHLICRRVKIIIAEAQYESPDTQDIQMKTQLAMLKRMVKGGASIKRGPWRRASNFIKNLSGPPAVIIDALLAGSTYESLLDTSNAQHAEQSQREAREMIEWANRSRAPVLSIGCPSGVSGSDGSAPVVEGEPLAVRPDKILSLGAPMQGLLDAVKNGEKWEISLADIGINITLRSDEAVAFGAQWVTELKFVGDEVRGLVGRRSELEI